MDRFRIAAEIAKEMAMSCCVSAEKYESVFREINKSEEKNMDIDFIKWMCEKAEGFRFSYTRGNQYVGIWDKARGVEDHEYDDAYDWFLTDSKWNSYRDIVYPLLLQRAIEFFMLSHPHESIWFIKQDCESIEAYRFYGEGMDRSKDREFRYIEHSIDAAKESALRYIYEQEKGK